MDFLKLIPSIATQLSEHKELTRIKEQYQLLLANIAAAILLYDNKGTVILVSPYTEVLTGYSVDYILAAGSDFLEQVVLETDLEKYKRAKQIAAVGEDMLVRYQIHHKKGFQLWLETRFVPVLDEQGKLKSIMALSVDLTESMNYQKLIEQQNQDISDFAYMISHDLKAPIFTIKGMANALLNDYASILGQAGKELIGYIGDASDRLNTLVASVIEYSSISTKTFEEQSLDLTEVINAVIGDLTEQIKEAGAELKIEKQLPTIRGAKVRIYQIFSNLFGNALKYRSPNRKLELILRLRNKTANFLNLEIQDNGLGIPANKINDIFRPFKRAHGNEISGSGIGLACVKKIVEKLGGTISVSSIEGQGSIFSLTLPLSTPEPQAIPEDLKKIYQE